MFDIEETKELYMQAMLDKAQEMADKISAYPFINSAVIQDKGIKVEFKESVELERQEILDVFIKGGVIKKAGGSKDKDGYIRVESIGDF